MSLRPGQVTAALVGTRTRFGIFQVQRFVNEYDSEPLTAILPGLALQELWSLLSVAERTLLVVSGFVVVVGLAGMLTALLTSLEERRREMAILRSLGARPVHVFSLVVGEAGLLALAGALVGVAALYALLSPSSQASTTTAQSTAVPRMLPVKLAVARSPAPMPVAATSRPGPRMASTLVLLLFRASVTSGIHVLPSRPP